MNREITIAGGGLAGLSLASGLRIRNIPVTVIEAGHYPRHKVCGEFISGVSEETLKSLGIFPVFEDAQLHRTVAWFNQGRLIHEASLTQPAFGISRHRLDLRLADCARNYGAQISVGTRADLIPREGLVRCVGRKPRNGRWIGIKMHMRGVDKIAALEMHSGSNGYAGLTDVEDGWTNVCGLFKIDRSIRANGDCLLAAYLDAGGNHSLANALRGAELRDHASLAVAGFEMGNQPSTKQDFAIGDASVMIPPFTGNGMSMAFASAEASSGPLAEWSQGRRSWDSAVALICNDLRKIFRRRMTVSGLLQPLLFHPAGRSLAENLAALRLLPFQPMLSLLR